MGLNVNKLLSDTNNKEFQLPLAPQDLWPPGLHHERRELRTCPCEADGTIQPQQRCNHQKLSRTATRGDS